MIIDVAVGPMTNTRNVLLCSASPRRRELLASLGVSFEVHVPGINEIPWPKEKPASYALRNASHKAREILDRVAPAPGAVLIAADTIVVKGDRILEKPVDAAHAAAMLRELSDAGHEVITGLCVLFRVEGGVVEHAEAVRTKVRFRALTEREIAAYVSTGEPMDKAGAYAIQGGAAGFVTGIDGSQTNVVGLPTEALRRILAGPSGH